MTFAQFKTQYHLNLNPQQEEAVQALSGPVLLLAVPGSGKTTVLVSRIGYLIAQGVPPENILTMTYTVSAARDMSRRLLRPTSGRPAGVSHHQRSVQPNHSGL